MRRLGRAAGTLALCAVAGGAARADVADYVGKPIASVRLLLDGRETTEAMLTRVVETVPGQLLAMAQVRESVTHLFSLGRFEDVRADATLENGRVVLRYDLVPIHPVARIRFRGGLDAPGVDEGALRRTITDRYGVSPPLGRVADMRRLLEDGLRERGYLHAAVTPSADTQDSRATLVFTVEPGDRARIGTVALSGQPSVPDVEFLNRLGLKTGEPYERNALDARIEKYVADRRGRGYYEAKVVPDAQFADHDRVVNLIITVSPGPHVRVVFTGDSLPSDRRAEFLPVEREGSVDEDLLEDAQNRIEEYFRAQGYRDAAAPHRREENAGELTITFDVKRGAQYRLAAPPAITGNPSIPLADFEQGLQLRPGAPFSAARLQADAALIESLYRGRGFARVVVQANVLTMPAGEPGAPVPVSVSLAITEGVRTVVDRVTFTGNTALDDAALRGRVGLQAGEPYQPPQRDADREAIQLAYLNLGYENATVEAVTTFSDDGTRVSVAFAIREGPQISIDHVLIVGNARTSTATIERELQVKPGDRFNLAAIAESRRRLTLLGLFRRVDIQELRHGEETTRDLLVTVEEAPPTTIGFGGGVEFRSRVVQAPNSTAAVDQLELAPRASFQIGRRNLFGKNRSADLFSSVSLHPEDAGQSNGTGIAGFGLAEYRVGGGVREPRVFDTAADATVNLTFEQQIRSSFNFARRILSADVARRFSRTVSATGSYQLQRTRLFDVKVRPEDQPLIDRTFTQFRLSSFSGSIVLDTRDDPIDPHGGESANVNAQVAGQHIWSEVGFFKTVATGQVFRTLPRTRRSVFAANARIGAATGFSNDGQLPASERFFAGGDTTVRGFVRDQLGVRHTPLQPGDTIDQDGFSIGGNGLVIFNAELRVPVFGGLSVVPFVDVGNVFARVADFDIAELRTTPGLGLRYKSPFGPLRFDLGLKVNRQPGEPLTAWFVSFGQAF
ncbi:MAG: BamA/TamA family outer membrane protein [Acidobacteria bacterium]|nr:BamA/TamA family outer membrane protein [Acidobacteriota bacterium]